MNNNFFIYFSFLLFFIFYEKISKKKTTIRNKIQFIVLHDLHFDFDVENNYCFCCFCYSWYMIGTQDQNLLDTQLNYIH